jgi:predicted transglutaminase-like cysteine proteinase
MGYLRFCAAGQLECKITDVAAPAVAISTARWKMLYESNNDVNSKIIAVTDQQLYGEAERWAYPKDKGDCEDFVLLKKRELDAADLAPATLLFTVVQDGHGQGHGVFSVGTDDEDFVLGKRRNSVLRRYDANCQFVKPQSTEDPQQWLSLKIQETPDAAKPAPHSVNTNKIPTKAIGSGTEKVM